MDLSDLRPPSSPTRYVAAEATVANVAVEQGLVAQLASEVAGPLTSALDRVVSLSKTGAIDRSSLAALRHEIEAARRAGLIGQQLSRLYSGQIRQVPEANRLTQMLRETLVQRGPEFESRRIQLRQALAPAEVVVDGSLLFSLTEAMLDWCLEHAKTAVSFRIDIKPVPAHARLACHFDHLASNSASSPLPSGLGSSLHQTHRLDSLNWRLVERIAFTMGLSVERTDGAADTTLTLEFPRTVAETMQGLTAVELDDGLSTQSGLSQPLAGSHLLVVAARRDVRTQVRNAVAHMGLAVDFVTSIDAAREFCLDGLPHAIVYESALADKAFEALKTDVLAQSPGMAIVEITEQGQTFEVSSFGGSSVARVGRDAIGASLPSALMFELYREN